MKSEWLVDSIAKSEYVSLPTPQSESKYQIVQLLNIQSKIVLVPTFRNKQTMSKPVWNVQPMTLMRLDETNQTSIEVFADGEPASFDPIQYLSDQLPDRMDFKIWDTKVSDYEGCITLHNVRTPVPRSPLTSSRASVLALQDALERQEYIGVARKISHWQRAGKFFDIRALESKRTYLQAVLSCQWLYAHGQKQFDSGRPAAYYDAIMKRPGKIDAKATGKQCKELMDQLEKGNESVALPALPAPTAPTKKRLLAVDDIDGDDGGGPAAKRQPPPIDDGIDPDEGDVKSTSSSSSSSSNSRSSKTPSKSRDGGSVDGDSSDGPEIPEIILGQTVTKERHRSGDEGLRVHCPIHWRACREFASLRKYTERYGPDAAQIILATWITLGRDMDKAKHSKHRPTGAEVKTYIQSLGHDR